MKNPHKVPLLFDELPIVMNEASGGSQTSNGTLCRAPSYEG